MSAAIEFAWTSKNSKTELHSVFEHAPIGLAQFQRQGRILAINPALQQMLADRTGTSASPLCFADLLPPQQRASAERLFRDLFEREGHSFQIESQSAGAGSRPLRWTTWRVRGANGNPDYAVALAEVCGHSPEAELRLQHAERLEAVGRLAGGVAHDFNNLLTGILLDCDLLLANLEPRHRVRTYAEEIRNAGRQATGLVKQLLAVARPATCQPSLLSLNDIAEGMRNLLVRLIGENIELKFDLDSNLGLVKMDPTQTQQILLNLVLNARDAMPAGGQITVESSNCKVQMLTETGRGSGSPTLIPCALLVVADNGSGMDEATRGHLFEAFFTTKAGKGTGLGLATVYDIVTRNGGLIHVDSAPRSGTRVSVLLPLVSEAVQDAQKGPDPSAKETASHRT